MAEKDCMPEIRFEGFDDEWEQRKLGELAHSFEYGLNAASMPYDGRVKYLRITDIDDDTREFRQNDVTSPNCPSDQIKSYLLHEGDLLFARTGASVGKTYRYQQKDGDVAFAGFLIRAIPNVDVNSDFLYQCTLTEGYRRYIEVTSQRSGQPGVNAAEYALWTLMAPGAEEEQRLIGSFFRDLDNLIALHQRKHEKLRKAKTALLGKMFPKPGSDVPELRFPGFTDPWEQRKFADFVSASGIRNSENLELPSYSVTNDCGFVPQDERFENGGTMREADKTSYWIVEPKSFAYNPARINVGSIGYQSTSGNVIVSSLYEVFRTDETCDDRFLWHWFKTRLFTQQIEMLQEGGVRLYFFFDKLLKSGISMPSADEQRLIGEQFDWLDSLITLHQRKLEMLRKVKKSLLEKMFA